MEILRLYSGNPATVYTGRDLETRFSVSVKTLRSDLEGLVEAGLLERVALNRRLTGYTRSCDYERRAEELRDR